MANQHKNIKRVMKELKFINGISIQVIILCLIGIGGTYLGDYLTSINWYGDYTKSSGWVVWGARHYWYNIGLGVLTLLQVIRIIMWSVNYWDND